MRETYLYISHNSALYYWRTNPPQYLLDDAARTTRVLKNCPSTHQQIQMLALSEAEFGPQPIDVLVPQGAPRPVSILRYHQQTAALPRYSIVSIRDGIHIVSPDLCFVQLCKALTLQEAVLLGMELCGTYALRTDDYADKATRSFQMTHASQLRKRLNAWSGIHGIKQGRVAAQYLVDGSASPMESVTYLLLCLPQQYGGYHMPRPELNPKVEVDAEFRHLLRGTFVKPDMLWRRERLVVEYDGGYHRDPRQAAYDERRRFVLEAMGYHVETLKKQHVYDPLAFDAFVKKLAHRLGVRIRPLSLEQQYARESLRDILPKKQTPTRDPSRFIYW